jgi:hypothetical protein
MYDYRDCARLGWAGCTRRDSVHRLDGTRKHLRTCLLLIRPEWHSPEQIDTKEQ